MKNTICLFLFSCIFQSAVCQTYNYKYFNSSEEFLSDYVYDIEQDSIGKVWFASSEGIIKFQTGKFEIIKSVEKEASNVFLDLLIYRGEVWSCGKGGELLNIKGSKVNSVNLDTKSRLQKILPLADNMLLVSSQNDGFFILDYKSKKVIRRFSFESLGIGSLNDILEYKGQFIVCSNVGIQSLSITKDKLKVNWLFSDLGGVNTLAIDNKGSVLIGTEYEGFYQSEMNNGIKNTRPVLQNVLPSSISVRSITIDSFDNYWISTYGKGVFKLSSTLSSPINFISSEVGEFEYVNKVFEDYEGNLWFATYGKGVVVLSNQYFSFLLKKTANEELITSISNKNGSLLYSEGSSIKALNSQNEIVEVLNLQGKKFVSLESKGSKIYFATSSSGVFSFDTLTQKVDSVFYDTDDLSRKVKSISIFGDELWICTYNGLFVYNLLLKKSRKYDSSNGLRHNLVNVVFQGNNGVFYVGSKNNRIFTIEKNGKESEFLLPNSTVTISVSSIQEFSNLLVIGTLGSGLYIRNKDVLEQFTEKDGLYSNFIYGILQYDSENVFLIHEDRITHLNLVNRTCEVLDNSFGISNQFALRSYCKQSNYFIIGSNSGIIRFDPKEYLKSKIIPRFGFNALLVNDSVFDIAKKTIKINYGKNVILLDYKGTTYNHKDGIKYYYKLSGFDEVWQEGQDSYYANFNNLPPGEYTFKVKACYLGSCFEKESPFKLVVMAPLIDRTWFRMLLIGLTVLSVYLIFVFQRNSERRKKRILEYNIELKTKEIKHKTDNIVASITYAKMIQDAVIPELQNFETRKMNLLAINYPKDIVGGDFLWCHKGKDGLIYYSLCDCTGHGVPGGFMTILAQNAIANLFRDKSLVMPNQILENLDYSLVSQLNKEASHSINDGMDMGLIAIDFEKGKLFYSGARRPLIYVDKSNELRIVKGTRRSIGDQTSKYLFELHEIDLNDILGLYLFSDGYIDQFGGPEVEKFSSKRLYSLIQEICETGIESQKEEIEKAFLEWKETANYQTDDMSFLAIKFV